MEENERIDRLGTALDVKGQSLVVVVARCSIGKEEGFFPALVSADQIPVELIVTRALRIVLEAVENICRMKVVDPMMIFLLGVVPGGIGSLILRRVLHRLLRQLPVRFVTDVRVSPGEQTCPER